MPDLLAHALIAYTIATIVSWRYAWLTPAYVTVVMAGAFIPDLAKADLLVRSGTIEHFLGIPFEWFALHTAGGALVSICIGVILVTPRERMRIGGLLSLGATSHLLADALLRNPSGLSYPLLWPLTRYHPPTPGLYLSTDPTPTVVVTSGALFVSLYTRFRRQRESA